MPPSRDRVTHASIAGVVDRPRLYRVIGSPLVRVCVVQGPSGCGKTTLLRSWLLHETNRAPVLWVSLNDTITSRQSFWHHVATSAARLGGLSEEQMRRTRAQLAMAADPVRIAADLLTSTDPVTIALDAYEYLGAAMPEIDADLARLVVAVPDLRLLITTRTSTGLADVDPPGGIARVITLGELALTTDEVQSLIEDQTGLDDPRLAASIASATRGYALAVRAVVLTLAQLGTVPRLDSAEWNAVVASRLESLLPDPVAVRFVTDTSVPPYVGVDLATALSDNPDAADLLAMLERSGFGRWIPYSRRGPVFQYVDAIRDTFRARAKADPERFRRSCVTTAQWLLENEEVVEQALQFAIDGEDYALADRVFVSVVIGNPDSYITDRFLPALRTVPPEVLDRYPMLAFALALALLTNPMVRAQGPWAARIAYGSTARPSYIEPTVDAFTLAGMQAIARRFDGRFHESADAAQEALALVDAIPPDLRVRYGETVGTVMRQLSYSLLQRGRIEEALDAVHRSVALLPTQTTRNYSTVYAAGINAFAGDLVRARAAFRAIDDDAWPAGLRNTYLNGPGLIAEGYELLDALDFTGAIEHLRGTVPYNHTAEFWPFFAGISVSARHGLGQAHAEAIRISAELAEPVPPPGVGDNVATERLQAAIALAWLAGGAHREAVGALADQPATSPYTAAARVAILLAEGRDDEALRRTSELLDLAGHTIRTRAELQTYGAVAALRAGDAERAWRWLNAATLAWESYGPRMHVALLTPSDRRLLYDLGVERESPSIRRYLDVPSSAGRPSVATTVSLTKREMVVLGTLVEHDGIRAVATALVVSPHTVKSQLQSIYRKLGVSSRQAAIAVARELGLLDQLPRH